MKTPVEGSAARRENSRYEARHHAFDRLREISCWGDPHTAGGHSQSAPATTDVTCGANLSAMTVTLHRRSRSRSAEVSPLTPAPRTRTVAFPFICKWFGTA